jgi:hypothetical protein
VVCGAPIDHERTVIRQLFARRSKATAKIYENNANVSSSRRTQHE